MKLSSLFKSQKKSSCSPLLCRLPHCGNPKTLSFRVENKHSIFNSQRFYNFVEVYMVKKVIEGLKIKEERFFIEVGGKTRSILDVSSSTLSKSNNNSTSGNGVEFLPFNDSCVMNLIDAYREETSSILDVSSSSLSKSNNSTSDNGGEFIPFNDSCDMDSIDSYGEETSSILDLSSSTLSKSNNSTSSNGGEFAPFNDSCDMESIDAYGEETSLILEASSSTLSKSNRSCNLLEYEPFNDSYRIRISNEKDLYRSFMGTMIRVIEANQGIKDWEESIEEILESLLIINEKHLEKYIMGAFCDLWMSYNAYTSRTYIPPSFTSPFSFSTSVPPNPAFLARVDAKADEINARRATTSSVIS